MKTRLIVLFILFLSFFAVRAQNCSSIDASKYLKSHLEITSSAGYLPHDTCLNKKLSIVFHIVLDSTGSPAMSLADLPKAIDTLNYYFKRICLSFMNCSTNYIPNHNYNKWKATPHEPPVFDNYYVDSTINIYLVESIIEPAGHPGYAFFPGGPDVIVVEKNFVATKTLVHEMGHFFGLPHTFGEISSGSIMGPSLELVNESNCQSTGDGFCDTEPDPYPTGLDPSKPCDYNYGPIDAMGNYYTPPLDNIMTYFNKCMCRFSQQQYNHMAYTYYTSRNYLH